MMKTLGFEAKVKVWSVSLKLRLWIIRNQIRARRAEIEEGITLPVSCGTNKHVLSRRSRSLIVLMKRETQTKTVWYKIMLLRYRNGILLELLNKYIFKFLYRPLMCLFVGIFINMRYTVQTLFKLHSFKCFRQNNFASYPVVMIYMFSSLTGQNTDKTGIYTW